MLEKYGGLEKYVLTGGPGTGKSTTLAELAKKGYQTVPEAARLVIQEEQGKEGGILPCLPWTNLYEFQRRVLERQLDLESRLNPAVAFLDRGGLDSIAYCWQGRIETPPEVLKAARERHYHGVFVLEPLPNYIQDQERRENLNTARELHQYIQDVYRKYGYQPITVPVLPVAERAQFILQQLKLQLSERQQHNKRQPTTKPQPKQPTREPPKMSRWNEIEKKYQVEHARIKPALSNYPVTAPEVEEEFNRAYDLVGLLTRNDCLLRIRTIGKEHLLTIKGPNQSTIMKKKFEYNLPIPAFLSGLAQIILPEEVAYHKIRETYIPFDDSSCKICLDYIPELRQEFVEIEASSENQVLLWEKRLGLAPYAIAESYPELVKRQKHEQPHQKV